MLGLPSLLLVMCLLPLAPLGLAAGTPTQAPLERGWFQAEDGTRLSYIAAGAGALTVVFVPGWLMPAEVFTSQVRALESRYRVLVLDPRGQGVSPVTRRLGAAERARDIHDLLRSRAVGDYVLVGWSLGVLEGLDFLSRHGKRGLRGVALIDNSIGLGAPPSSSVPAARPTQRREFHAYAERFARSMFKAPPPPHLLTAILDSTRKLPPSDAWGLLNKPYPRTYYRDTVLSLEVPVWYAVTVQFSAQADELVALCPGASATVFPEAGHALFVDASERFNHELLGFVERAVSGGHRADSAKPCSSARPASPVS